MSLKIGIVGLPNVGKSTLFNALTNRSVPAENYPFCTIDPAVGVVAVPDPRLTQLSELSKSGKTIPAAVEFTDIAGLVKGAAEGEGLGNQFLAHIRETDAIAEVVRVFKDPNVIHVHGTVNPLYDIEVINLELAIADMQVVAKRRLSLEKETKQGKKEAMLENSALVKIEKSLLKGEAARMVSLTDEERTAVKSAGLLTAKPVLYILNIEGGGENPEGQPQYQGPEGERVPYGVNAVRHGAQQIAYGAGIPEDLKNFLKKERAAWVALDASLECDIARAAEGDRANLREGLGIQESGMDALVRASHDALGLITFFTTGADETRGWTIERGTNAKDAGAAIHSDFRDKFIRAEVVFWKDLIDVGSYAAAREKGLVRTEGKEYIVKDGDVIEFKI